MKPLAQVPVQEINRLVMGTEDLALLSSWLEEEKAGAKRMSAMTRIHHRFNLIRSRTEHAEILELAKAKA